MRISDALKLEIYGRKWDLLNFVSLICKNALQHQMLQQRKMQHRHDEAYPTMKTEMILNKTK